MNCWNTIYARKPIYNSDVVSSIISNININRIRNTSRAKEATMYTYEQNNKNEHFNPMSCFTHEPALDIDDCFRKFKIYIDNNSSAHGINVSMFNLNTNWRPKVVEFLLSYKDKSVLHKINSIVRFTVNIWHRDIENFLDNLTPFESHTDIFSWCVGIEDEFLEAVKSRKTWILYEPSLELINNFNSRHKANPLKTVSAYELYTKLMRAQSEHKFAIINLSQMNKLNMNPNLGSITCTNICTEITGLGSFVCCLGSINLDTCINTDHDQPVFDFELFQTSIRDLVYHLNYLIEITHIKDETGYCNFAKKSLRPIGIGLAGLADCLVMLGLQYESDEAYKFLDKIMYIMTLSAVEHSIELGQLHPELQARGWKGSRWSEGLFPFDLSERTPMYRELDRENSIRSRMKSMIACNCNLLTMMPNFGRTSEGITPSINPISSLKYSHISSSSHQINKYYKLLPENYYSVVDKTNGEWNCNIPDIFKTVTVMDPKRVRDIKKICNDYCDMSTSTTHHIKVTPGVNKYSNIISTLNLYLRFKTCVYYIRENIYYDQSEECQLCTV